MLRNTRVLWAAGVFIAALFLTPAIALCVEEDPYIYRSLIGRAYFEYQKTNAQSDGAKTKSSRFQQVYSLDVRGNFMSRRLVIYDAGLSYTFTDYESNSVRTDTDGMSYFLRTTILPKSSIPLTLYGSQTETTNAHATTVSTVTTTNYGLTWNVRMRPLPIMLFNMDTAKTESQDSETQTDSKRFEAKKEIGPTQNQLFFFTRDTSNKGGGSGESSSYSLNFTNNTKISKSTTFDFNSTRSVTEQVGTTSTSANGYALSLSSSPSLDFSQHHSYSFFSTKSDGRQQGTNYAGDMSYQFSKDLSSSFSLTVNSTNNELATTTQETSNLSSSGNVSYKLMKNLIVSEVLAYSSFETNSTDQTSSNTSDFKSFSATTNVGYSQTLSWAFFTSNYGLGVVKEKSSAGKGTGISQNVGLALSNIDFNRYAIFNTSFAYSGVKNTTGDVKSEQRAFDASATNKLWRKYVTTSASYRKGVTSSWVPGLDTKYENYRVDAGTGYFKKTNLMVFADEIKTFNETNAWSTVLTEGIVATHRNQVFAGTLELAMDVTNTERDFTGGKEKFLTKHLNAKYSRVIRRPIFWSAEADWSERKENASMSRVAFLQNNLTYPLRAWLFSFEHRYTLRETNNQDTNENVYLLKAMRTFVRFF